MGANSPFLFGQELWRETRIALFEQATDTRPEELKAQGVRPRVWFGERWITSIFDLFEENVRYFPALLPICDDEDPVDGARRAATRPSSASCGCTTARSTAGTGRSTTSSTGRPHLRVENRVLPAGPTVADIMANAAFYYGLVRALAEERAAALDADVVRAPPRRTSTPAPGTASTPGCTGRASARCRRPSWSCAACCRWPTRGWTAGASTRGDRDRLLGIIEQRCLSTATARAGSWTPWPPSRRAGLDRSAALREMTVRYRELMHANDPVHTWPEVGHEQA